MSASEEVLESAAEPPDGSAGELRNRYNHMIDPYNRR